jgi:hypothetical protein
MNVTYGLCFVLKNNWVLGFIDNVPGMIKGSFDDPSSGNITATTKVDIQDSKKCSLSLIFSENQQIVMYPKFGMIFAILRK